MSRYSSLVLAGALIACGGPHDPPSSTSVVSLTTAGDAPQRALQYAPKPATRRVRITAGDARAPSSMTFVVELETTSATPLHARFHGIDALVPQFKGSASAPDPQIGEFVRHVAGTLASDVHGRATANADTDRVWTAPSIPAALSMMIVPLPTEPIGVGARWHVTGADPVLAVSDAVFDYQLDALDGDGATVRWRGRATVLSGGATVTMEGTATVRFDGLVPARASVVQHVPASTEIPAADIVMTVE